MMTYVKPTLVEYGGSENLIKGECGWGGEGLLFDKTGSKKNKFLWKWGAPFACPGPGVVNTCRRCEYKSGQCSEDTHDC